MNAQQASNLIALLEQLASKPHLILGKSDILLTQVFLCGFRVALERALGLEPGLHERVLVERGWTLPEASGPDIDYQMLRSGMSPEQVIQELVGIEVEVIKQSTT